MKLDLCCTRECALSCCRKYCRRDKAVHVGRFSQGVYGLQAPAFQVQYPQGLKLPVDGVPTDEGPLPNSSDLLGFFDVARSSIREKFNLDFASTQVLHSHNNWIASTADALQVPDITLDWSPDNTGVCFRSATAAMSPRKERLTVYGSGEYGAQHTVRYTNILSNPGSFVFNKAVSVPVTAVFNQSSGDYPAGPNAVNVIVYTNSAIGVKEKIKDVPSSCYRQVDPANAPSWIGQGSPDPQSRSTYSRPNLVVRWSDFYGNGNGPLLVHSSFLNVFQYLFSTRDNLHVNVNGDTISTPPWMTRSVFETLNASLSGFVQNGNATLLSSLSGEMFASGQAYAPRWISTSEFTETGPTEHDPQQLTTHLDPNLTPKLQLTGFGGSVIAEIDIASQLPDFINTDPTQAVYALAVWTFPGNKPKNDLFTGAAPWDVQFTRGQLTGGVSPNSYFGHQSRPMFFGRRDVTFEVDNLDSVTLSHLGAPIATNSQVDRWSASASHATGEIPRATWKANEDFCRPLGDADQVARQTHNRGTTEYSGVVYQGTGANESHDVQFVGPDDSQFCRAENNALDPLAMSITITGTFAVGQTLTVTYTATNNTDNTILSVGINDFDNSGPPAPSQDVASGQSANHVRSYVVTQADIDAGSVAFQGQASGLEDIPGFPAISSPQVTETHP